MQRLLLGCADTAPADLPLLASDAADILGAGSVRMYLVDYAQTFLTPFTAGGTPVAVPPADRVSIDGTLAGRAYALCEPTETPGNGGAHRTYLPMTDCGHRVGVLRGRLAGRRSRTRIVRSSRRWPRCWPARRDPALYGDAIEHLRRGLPMQLATEIVWSLLPPLTLTTPDAEVTGILEPCYEVGGDAFDYAVGDGLCTSRCSTPSARHRCQRHDHDGGQRVPQRRRCGLDLFDTYRSIDKWLRGQYPDQFVTACSPRLRAEDRRPAHDQRRASGRPAAARRPAGQGPAGADRMPLGLGTLVGDGPEIVEEALEPGDHVLFYTDGVIEARSVDGEFFGRQRLVDFVVRTLADRVPAPETMRRLVRAILDYQHEQLQDDATAVLLGWSGRIG
jgi:hypothetical protein